MSAVATSPAAPASDEVALSMPEDDLRGLSGEIDSAVAAVAKGELPVGLLESVKSALAEKKKQAAPWHDFVDVRRASKPKTLAEATSRISTNLAKYSANYFFVSLGLVAYCLLMQPLLILAFGFLGATVTLVARGGAERRVAGYTLTKEDQLKFCAMMTLPLLWMSGFTGTIFWVVGASLLIVLAHAAAMPKADADVLPETI